MCPTSPAREPRGYFFGEVLRLPPGLRDPDHYTLLGLPFFVADHDQILRAAMERMRMLEACDADDRPGYPEALAWIRRRIQSAQQTLLDPEKRKRYDARLIGRTRPEEPAPAGKRREFRLVTGRMFADRYRVMGEARWGGLGTVYEVLDGSLRRRMHLTVLPPSRSSDQAVYRRVEQAARAAATLDHPNIVAINEVGDEQGQLYVTTRPPEGRSLFEWIEGTPRMRLEPALAREITLEVARALAHAHSLGVTHGDLRPNRIYRDVDGSVRVVDFRISRAAGGRDATDPRFLAPEGRDSISADLFALGCVAYQMLTGLPPAEGADPDHLVAGLPDEVPDDLARLLKRLLAPDPDRRPASAAKVIEQLIPSRAPRRRRTVGAAIAVTMTAVVAALIGVFTIPDTERMGAAAEAAWDLIAEEDYNGALEHLREARIREPENQLLVSPMTNALDGAAEQAMESGDPWGALALYGEAQVLMATRERAALMRACRTRAEELLRGVWFECPEVVQEVMVRVHVGQLPVVELRVDDREVAISDGTARLEIEAPEGPRTIPWRVADISGNVLEGELRTVVDRTPPELEIVKPEPGRLYLTGEVRVEIRLKDANPPANLIVRGKPVELRGGVARVLLRLADGEHDIPVEATDLAGLHSQRSVSIVVDGQAPRIELEKRRLVTRNGRVLVRGRVQGRDLRLTVAGTSCPIGPEGCFERTLTLAESGSVPIEAVGANGIRRAVSVEVVVDRRPPVVEPRWDRRGQDGTLLYGLAEIVTGELRVGLVADDASGVTYTPGEGRVEEGTWILDATQGRRSARLVARDEAGNESTLELFLEGHRGQPRLQVTCDTPEITSATEAALEIETNRDLRVQGEPADPGRVRVPLEEGTVLVEVVAHDRYGNETTWSRRFRVDRTPPRLTLRGPSERGVGRQMIEIESNEPLASITCAGRTVAVEGNVARVEVNLHPGRKKLRATARDLAGNEAKAQWPLVVRNRILLLDGKGAVRLDLDLASREELTVECWVRGVEPAAKRMAVLSNGGDQGFGIFWSSMDKSLPYASVLVSEKGYTAVAAKRAWRWDAWAHLALVYDGRRLRFFVNGSLQGTESPMTGMNASKLPVLIGAEPTTGQTSLYNFIGAIDEVRISSVTRYRKTFRPARYFDADRDTLALLHFDVMSEDGKSHPDASGNGNHGISSGSARLGAGDR